MRTFKVGMVHSRQNHRYKFIARSRGFLPRTGGAVRNRGYKIVKVIVCILNHASKCNIRMNLSEKLL